MTNPLVPKLLSEAKVVNTDEGRPAIVWERVLTPEEIRAIEDWLDSVTV